MKIMNFRCKWLLGLLWTIGYEKEKAENGNNEQSLQAKKFSIF